MGLVSEELQEWVLGKGEGCLLGEWWWGLAAWWALLLAAFAWRASSLSPASGVSYRPIRAL